MLTLAQCSVSGLSSKTIISTCVPAEKVSLSPQLGLSGPLAAPPTNPNLDGQRLLSFQTIGGLATSLNTGEIRSYPRDIRSILHPRTHMHTTAVNLCGSTQGQETQKRPVWAICKTQKHWLVYLNGLGRGACGTCYLIVVNYLGGVSVKMGMGGCSGLDKHDYIIEST